ncbi:MAG TPA: molybdate ABC transporter substrate-binding protein [Burkholderiales bacterium]|nr:molybdate ABC transporter substrate-binding protein [Burkholderiales bacterium]
MSRILLALLAWLLAGVVHAQPPRLVVFAAASLKNALDEAAASYPLRPVIAYGASSALAKQIENGAPADVFMSADLDWMDYLQGKGLLVPGTRRNLLGNRLVLIAPAKQPQELDPAPGFAIGQALGKGRLALAEPSSVPAGKYAKAALSSVGVWDAVRARIASAENVRAALLLVARGEAPLGIVYQTDAREERDVMVAGVFPAATHPPIVYPVAALKAAKPGADAFLRFLSAPQARRIFEKHGFTVN